ncbi:Lsr2 family DNA-binding protein, partial [Rhodococcus jostii]|uniref:Lsr2 family DNA-binding protein n=1 Tax=Rhodococcus jostii TaxID=132919 RepID=UPI0035E48D9B
MATKAPAKSAAAVSKAPAKATTKEIREWAIGEGREVSPRGRVSAEIEQAFLDAQAETAPARKVAAKSSAAEKTAAEKTVAEKTVAEKTAAKTTAAEKIATKAPAK